MRRFRKGCQVMIWVMCLALGLFLTGWIMAEPPPPEASTNIWPGDLLAFTPVEDGVRMQIPGAGIDVIVDEAKMALDDLFTPNENLVALIDVLKAEKAELEAEILLLQGSTVAKAALSPYKEACYQAANMIDSRPHTGITQTGQITHGW